MDNYCLATFSSNSYFPRVRYPRNSTTGICLDFFYYTWKVLVEIIFNIFTVSARNRRVEPFVCSLRDSFIRRTIVTRQHTQWIEYSCRKNSWRSTVAAPGPLQPLRTKFKIRISLPSHSNIFSTRENFDFRGRPRARINLIVGCVTYEFK